MVGMGIAFIRKARKPVIGLLLLLILYSVIVSPVDVWAAWDGNTETIADSAETYHGRTGWTCAEFVKYHVLKDLFPNVDPGIGWGSNGKTGYENGLKRFGATEVAFAQAGRGDIIAMFDPQTTSPNYPNGTPHIAIISRKDGNQVYVTHSRTKSGVYKVYMEKDGRIPRLVNERNATFWRIGTPKGTVSVVTETVTMPLGGVDLDAYCRQKGYTGVHLGNPQDAGSWTCQSSSSGWSGYDTSSSGISVTQACREQYRNSNAYAEASNWNDAYSWGCYVKRSFYINTWFFRKQITYTSRLGGVNMRGFCQQPRSRGTLSVNGQRLSISTKYRDVSVRANDAGSWQCTGKSVYTYSNASAEINVTEACQTQKRNPNAYARATNWNNAYSWQCYVNQTVTKTVFQGMSVSNSKTEFSIMVTKSGTGSGTVSTKDVDCGPDCTGGAYPLGSFVDLKAVPAADSTFAGWQVNGKPASGAIPINADPVITALFNKKPETRPIVTGVSPNPTPRKPDWSRQWLTIYGNNFQSGAKLLFKIVGTDFVYPDRVPDYISSTELRYFISVGPTVYDWTVEVINPDGQVSNAYGFQVR